MIDTHVYRIVSNLLANSLTCSRQKIGMESHFPTLNTDRPSRLQLSLSQIEMEGWVWKLDMHFD